MNEAKADVFSNVQKLRDDFDHGFVTPIVPPATDLEALLGIQVNGRPFAFRISELFRIEPPRKIVPIPGAIDSLLGVAGIQGRATSVHSLSALLGFPNSSQAGLWIAVIRAEEPFGLAFDSLDEYLQARRSEFLTLSGSEQANGRLKQAVKSGGVVRPIVSVSAVLLEIQNRAGVAPGDGSLPRG